MHDNSRNSGGEKILCHHLHLRLALQTGLASQDFLRLTVGVLKFLLCYVLTIHIQTS
jgi:hypothetical protein